MAEKKNLLRDALSMKSASALIEGEEYEIRGYEIIEVDDKFNRGEIARQIILNTDKGRVFAPRHLSNLVTTMQADDPDGWKQAVDETLHGARVRCTRYHNKRYGKDCLKLEFID